MYECYVVLTRHLLYMLGWGLAELCRNDGVLFVV